jgi:acetyl-CoA decarbonylase/synthase complex subunit gamma
MALSGIDIFKMLPKTNCRKCGFPTCLAFATNLAAGKVEASLCPYLSEEAKAELAKAKEAPIRTVTIGVGEKALKIGGERVMFRHEKKFEHAPGLAVLIRDTMDDAEIDGRIERFGQLQYEQIGLRLRGELIAIRCDSHDAQRYASVTRRVKEKSDANIILMSENTDLISAGLDICAGNKPLLYAATRDNAEGMADLAKQYACPLAAKASGIDELIDLTTRLTAAGVNDIVLDSGSRALRRAFEDQTFIRRAALYKRLGPLAFPTIVFPCEMTDDPLKEAVIASLFVAKYGGIIVLSDFQGETLFPLLLERLGIYTDPQDPLKVSEGIYEIGRPDENSPVLLTSSWSLSYLILSSAVETSNMSAFILVKFIDSADVMCWCPHCLRSSNPSEINWEETSKFIENSGLKDKINHRRLIAPKRFILYKDGLEKFLPEEWEIIISTEEADRIAAFYRTL